MTVYRANYGDALFGQDSFGLSGSFIDAAAVVTPSASVTVGAVNVISFTASVSCGSSADVDGQTVKLAASAASADAAATSRADRIIGGASAASIAATAAAAGEVVKDGAVAASLQNVVVSLAETYAETDGYRTGYGLRTYGTSIYGENHSVEEASASVSISSSATASGERIGLGAAEVAVTATVISNGVIDVVGRATVPLSSSVNISYNRVRLMSASDTADLTVSVLSRYKWLDADDPETTWTAALAPSNTWVEADYLERAA